MENKTVIYEWVKNNGKIQTCIYERKKYISPELIDAYSNTDYEVYNPDFTIKIGKKSRGLEKLLRENSKTTWAYISAYNPYSKSLTKKENEGRHLQLLAFTKEYICFDGEGIGEDPNWEPEKSLLILGISKTDASALGNNFEQNAILIGEVGKVAELLLLL